MEIWERNGVEVWEEDDGWKLMENFEGLKVGLGLELLIMEDGENLMGS